MGSALEIPATLALAAAFSPQPSAQSPDLLWGRPYRAMPQPNSLHRGQEVFPRGKEALGNTRAELQGFVVGVLFMGKHGLFLTGESPLQYMDRSGVISAEQAVVQGWMVASGEKELKWS